MTNVFSKLLTVQPIEDYPNAMLYINFGIDYAYITISAESKEEVDISMIPDSFFSLEKILRIIRRLGMHVNGDTCLLNLFIDVRDDILEEERKEKEREKAYLDRRTELISAVKNKEVQNIEYYGSFIGRKYIHDLGLRNLSKIFKDFKRARANRVQELHHLMRINEWHKTSNDVYDPDRLNYNSIMGLDYIHNMSRYGHLFDFRKDCNIDELINPLADLNPDYTKRRIHIINVELAYINSNIKAIKKEIRERLKDEKFHPSPKYPVGSHNDISIK